MIDYHKDNLFEITKEDETLYLQMENLFKLIEKHYKENINVLNSSVFEWTSEAYGLPEESNKLTIKKKS